VVIHKFTNTSTDAFCFTECGRALHIEGGQAVSAWEAVTCKQCLKKHYKEV
jgi:hypothetical protein